MRIMRLIKSAWVYGAPLPECANDDLREKFEQHLFNEPASSQRSSHGFAPNAYTGELVSDITDGWSITVRIDEKVIPAAAIAKRVDEAVQRIEARDDRHVYRKERQAIHDDVLAEMLPVAFVKTRLVPVFYYAKFQLLLVCTGAANDADIVTRLMRAALGSLKAVPLDIDGLEAVLTEGLRTSIRTGDADLGPLALGGFLQLQSQLSSQRLAVNAGANGEVPLDDINEALSAGYLVTAISLHGPSVSFKLTPHLAFKSIVYGERAEEQDEIEGMAELWRHEASIQVMLLCHQVKLLLELAGSMFPVFEDPA